MGSPAQHWLHHHAWQQAGRRRSHLHGGLVAAALRGLVGLLERPVVQLIHDRHLGAGRRHHGLLRLGCCCHAALPQRATHVRQRDGSWRHGQALATYVRALRRTRAVAVAAWPEWWAARVLRAGGWRSAPSASPPLHDTAMARQTGGTAGMAGQATDRASWRVAGGAWRRQWSKGPGAGGRASEQQRAARRGQEARPAAPPVTNQPNSSVRTGRRRWSADGPSAVRRVWARRRRGRPRSPSRRPPPPRRRLGRETLGPRDPARTGPDP